MQAMTQYRIDAISMPTFTYAEANNDMELDFNMLSEYLMDDDMGGKVPTWTTSMEAFFGDPKDMPGMSESFGEELDSSAEDDDGHTTKRRKTSGKGNSQDQIDRRRERNRVLARKTRLRKKFFFESLQRQVTQLASENELLKNVVRQRMSAELRNKILSECKTHDLPPVVASQAQAATAMLEKADFNLMQAIQAAQRSFVITDPSLPDNPIIFASKGFLDLCGYQLEEVLGRNCRFLQGPNTDPKQVEALRNGITNGVDTSVCLLNYRADGSQFYNQIFVAALRNAENKIINYVGVQVEIKQAKQSAASDRNSSAVATALREGIDPATLGAYKVKKPRANSNKSNSSSVSAKGAMAVVPGESLSVCTSSTSGSASSSHRNNNTYTMKEERVGNK
jgi:PAS domain S-box-containing protein